MTSKLPAVRCKELFGAGLEGKGGLQVFRLETRALGDACQHLGSDLFAIVEGEHDVCPTCTRENFV